MTKPLAPCPWCGRQPEQFSVHNAYRCPECSKNSGWLSFEHWQRRADPAPDEVREERSALLTPRCAEDQETATRL
jgi:hypothetical protein